MDLEPTQKFDVFSNKWLTLIFGGLVMLVSGLQYLFPIFSEQLKDIFGYNQKEINLVGTLGLRNIK